jgi:hypothetical protein
VRRGAYLADPLFLVVKRTREKKKKKKKKKKTQQHVDTSTLG